MLPPLPPPVRIPANFRFEKLEIEPSQENPKETELFLKSLDAQGIKSMPIGKWEEKKFHLYKNLENINLQQLVVRILNSEVECTPSQTVLLCKELVDQGVSLNISTLLHYAALNGDLELVKKLVKQGMDFDAKDDIGRTPLSYAAQGGKTEIVAWLLKKGADVNTVSQDGKTPLLWAVSTGNLKTVEALLEKGANPNIAVADGSKNTPLHYAVMHPSPEIAKLLLNHGAAIDAVNSKGQQAIHYSILNSTTDCLSLLIKDKANVNAQDSETLTPLCWAEALAKEPFVRLLLDKKANPDLVTEQGIALNVSSRENADAIYPDATKTLAHECMKRREMGLSFGIKGKSQVSLAADPKPELIVESYSKAGGSQMVTNSMQAFSINKSIAKNDPDKELFEEAWGNALTVMQGFPTKDFDRLSEEAQSEIIQDYLKKLEEGKTIVIPTGWRGHAVYMVFKKTQEGLLFVNCNRGIREDPAEGGITIYKVENSDQLNADTLRRLLTANDRSFTESFLRVGATKLEHLGLKDQKARTCSFTSAKTAVFANLYLFFKEKGMSDKAAFDSARKCHRSWIQFARTKAIQEMLNEYETSRAPPYKRDDRFLLSVLSKMKTEGPVMLPEYEQARKRLMTFLEKNAPEPWNFNYEVDNMHLSPLTYAVKTKQKDLIELMLKKGGKINDKDPGGMTPLERSVVSGDEEMASFLINLGAKIYTPSDGMRAIRLALQSNRKELALSLLKKAKEQGVDLKAPDSSGTPLMHAAVRANSQDIMEFLLASGCALNESDSYGFTTLEIAIELGKSDAVDYLIEKGVSLEKNSLGRDPIQFAIDAGYPDIARKLAREMK
jgi:ankyrin repeat protein